LGCSSTLVIQVDDSSAKPLTESLNLTTTTVHAHACFFPSLVRYFFFNLISTRIFK